MRLWSNGYECNKKVKFGTSFCNKNGQRPKSHKTSVPNLDIGFVVYSSKKNLQNLNKAIKERFNMKGKNEHINCEILVLEKFVFDMCLFIFKTTLGVNTKSEMP